MSQRKVTEQKVRQLIRDDLASYGGVRGLARKLKCSAAYVSDVARGRRNPGPIFLRHYGLRAVVTRRVHYEPA